MEITDSTPQDVMAPGYQTYSARGQSSCVRVPLIFYLASNQFLQSLIANHGTSMATPAVAGAAALVRQYLSSSAFG